MKCKRIIWMYWDGPEPDHIRLCRESVEKHAGHWRIRRCFPNPSLRKDWHNIPVAAHRADYLRAVVLLRHGGLWIDSDVLIWEDLDIVWDMIQEDGDALFGRFRQPFMGFMGCRAGHPLIEKWLALMDKRLDISLEGAWTMLAADFLWPLAREMKDLKVREARRILPIPGTQWRKLLGLGKRLADWIPDDSIGMHLFNEASGKKLRPISAADLLVAENMLGEGFRKAVGIEE